VTPTFVTRLLRVASAICITTCLAACTTSSTVNEPTTAAQRADARAEARADQRAEQRAEQRADGRNEMRTDSDRSDGEKRARVRLELASAYFGRNQFTTALDEVKLALLAKPDLHEGFNLRGLIYASLGETRLADESFQRALQLQPRDADTLHNYAWYHCQQRRYDEAERLFGQVMTLPQYDGIARSLLAQGVCQARGGRMPEAERTLSRSYELDPGNPATAYNLSEVLLRNGQLERARFYVGRINSVPEQVTAQSLWLAARIEHKAGASGTAQQLGRQLRDRFPQSPEALQFERGRFNES
jgi:type IV pilus assembly protein PilF